MTTCDDLDTFAGRIFLKNLENHNCVSVSVAVGVCASAGTCVHILTTHKSTHPPTLTSMCIYVGACVSACMCAYVHTYVYTYTHTNVQTNKLTHG